jgi:hypothetical protein
VDNGKGDYREARDDDDQGYTRPAGTELDNDLDEEVESRRVARTSFAIETIPGSRKQIQVPLIEYSMLFRNSRIAVLSSPKWTAKWPATQKPCKGATITSQR